LVLVEIDFVEVPTVMPELWFHRCLSVCLQNWLRAIFLGEA
jgi:hypothetical protein